ncbi:hypothetical protein [Archangium lipolyticum]|uniref:hypothetical protein n=1 Tax=Archangium lipolyticum TaxID=2970465 RepID=UPI002149EA3D|nr:hypothetical protein [Archangium lipolyticum]
MRIGNFGSVPSINLGKIATSALRSAGEILGKVVHSGSQSGFELAGSSPHSATGGASNLSHPPATLGTKAALAPPPGFDMRKLVEKNMGKDAAKLFDELPPEQQKELAMQASMQNIGTNLLSNMLQTLHDMGKAIAQNTRY